MIELTWLIDLVWLALIFISLGAVTTFAAVRSRTNLFFAVIFAAVVLVSGFEWWRQEYERYENKLPVFHEIYGSFHPFPGLAYFSSKSLEGSPDRISGNQALNVVAGFYHALSLADGEAASQLVIPEKRVSGNYAPANISAFYSTLLRPLRLDSEEAVSDGNVRVSYDYVGPSGGTCHDSALVILTPRDDAWLIATIIPYGRC